MDKNYKTLSLVLGAMVLVMSTAAASIYMTKEPAKQEQAQAPVQKVVVAEQHTVRRKCDDGNIAGKAVGGIGGGVLGSMVGKGDGKTAATIGGTLGGAYIGGQAIPLNNITCQ